MGPSIIAFPLRRQHRLVSEIANMLLSKSGNDATLFWRETAKDLLRQLAENGVALQAAEDEVRSLLYAVVAEMEGQSQEARG